MPYFKGDFFDVDCIASKGKLLDFQSKKEIIKINFFFIPPVVTVENSLIKNYKKFYFQS